MNIEREKIWIANLPPRITEYAILKLVKPYGTIKDFFFHYERNDQDIKSLSYCFITYENCADAEKAQKALNKLYFSGKRLIVQFAKPKLLDNGNIDMKQFENLIREITTKAKQSSQDNKIDNEVLESEIIESLIMKNKTERDRSYLKNISRPDFYDKLSSKPTSQEIIENEIPIISDLYFKTTKVFQILIKKHLWPLKISKMHSRMRVSDNCQHSHNLQLNSPVILRAISQK